MGLFDHWLKADHNPLSSGASEAVLAEQDATRMLEEGMAFESEGQLDEAIRCYDSAIQLVPELARAHFNRGNILLDRGDAQGALLAYTKAVQYKPDSASAHYNMGNSLHRLGLHQEAIEAYSAAIAVKPEFSDAEIALGNVLDEMGKLDESTAHFRRAIEINPDCANSFFQQGIQCQDRNLPDQAQACYRKALQIQPAHLDALNNLGVILIQEGQWNEAVEVLLRALKVASGSAEIYRNLGIAYLALRKFTDAAECFRCVVGIHPEDVTARVNLGNALSELHEHEAALTCFIRAYELNPASNEALFNQGVEHVELKQYDKALAIFLQVLATEPSSAEAYSNMGLIKEQLLQTDEAIALYQKAIAIKPDFAVAYSSLGHALQTIGKTQEATQCYIRALEINPDLAVAHCAYGLLFNSLDQLEQAELHYRRAIELQPNLHDAHNNLGVVLGSTRRFEEAITCFQRALEIKPDFASAYVNWASVMKDRGQISQALVHLHHAIKLEPDMIEAHSSLLFIHNYLEDQAAELMFAEAKQFGEVSTRSAIPYTAWTGELTPERKLRVGFVSGDLCIHPVGYFAESVITSLSKIATELLDIYAYPTTVSNDDISRRIKACCTVWCSAVGMSDEALAHRIHSDHIDILIDLAGHSAHNRLPVFAWKPAPIQVSWLGYFATTGIAAIDYLIADHWTLPPSEEVYFTEKIWRLADTRLCFTMPEAQVSVSPLPAMDNGYVTFGCFNNLAKMNDAVVALWARILHAMPASCLFLKSIQIAELSLRQEICERFAAQGIDANRLILEAYGPRADYLATYQRVDIALDPFPFPGGTTTVEALWMGVPVLTLAGERFLSRQGVGLLMNAGLSEWVASDPDDYVARAVSHASDLQRLATLRAGLRQQVLASPIFDAPRFARHFEAALRGMWQKWCAQNTGVPLQTEEVRDGAI